MSEEYRKFDPADYVKSEEDVRGLLRAAVDEDPRGRSRDSSCIEARRPDAEYERPRPRDWAKPRQPIRSVV